MEKIIIDTDCAFGYFGRDIDDVLAILLALGASDRLEIVGITCCHGNIDEPRAYESVKRVLALADRTDIPVLRGAKNALELGQKSEASEFLEAELRKGGVTLVPIAPLTNFGTVERLQPGTLALAKRIVAMGGALDRSILPKPILFELNFFKDPESAEILLGSGADLTLIPLDLTLQIAFGPQEMARVKASPAKLAEALKQPLSSWYRFMSVARMRLGFPPHDPLAIGYLIHPEWYEVRKERLKILKPLHVRGGLARSETGSEVSFCHRVDPRKFLPFLLETGLGVRAG